MTRGFTDGTLSCTSNNCQFDVTACTLCGNGTVEMPEEECDGNTVSCNAHLGGGWMGMVTCTGMCGWNTNACCRALGASCTGAQTCCGDDSTCGADDECCLQQDASCSSGDECCSGMCTGNPSTCN
jgi:hypothetical protein